jgi:hypothetical protein
MVNRSELALLKSSLETGHLQKEPGAAIVLSIFEEIESMGNSAAGMAFDDWSDYSDWDAWDAWDRD